MTPRQKSAARDGRNFRGGSTPERGRERNPRHARKGESAPERNESVDFEQNRSCRLTQTCLTSCNGFFFFKKYRLARLYPCLHTERERGVVPAALSLTHSLLSLSRGQKAGPLLRIVRVAFCDVKSADPGSASYRAQTGHEPCLPCISPMTQHCCASSTLTVPCIPSSLPNRDGRMQVSSSASSSPRHPRFHRPPPSPPFSSSNSLALSLPRRFCIDLVLLSDTASGFSHQVLESGQACRPRRIQASHRVVQGSSKTEPAAWREK